MVEGFEESQAVACGGVLKGNIGRVQSAPFGYMLRLVKIPDEAC